MNKLTIRPGIYLFSVNINKDYDDIEVLPGKYFVLFGDTLLHLKGAHVKNMTIYKGSQITTSRDILPILWLTILFVNFLITIYF